MRADIAALTQFCNRDIAVMSAPTEAPRKLVYIGIIMAEIETSLRYYFFFVAILWVRRILDVNILLI